MVEVCTSLTQNLTSTKRKVQPDDLLQVYNEYRHTGVVPYVVGVPTIQWLGSSSSPAMVECYG